MSQKAGSVYVEIVGRMKKLEDALNKAERAAKKSSEAMQKQIDKNISSGFDRAGKSAANFAKSIASIGAVYAVGAISKDIIQVGMNFEKTMKTVQAVSGATKKEFEDLTGIARKMGETTEWSASQSGDALKFMAMAGMTAKQSIQALPGMLNLATAAQMDLAQSTDIVTDTMTAFGLGVSDLTRLSDVFITTATNSNTTVQMLGESFKYVAPVASNFGYTIEQTAGMLGAMANAGIKASDAGTDLRQALTRTAAAAQHLGMEAGASLIDVLKEMKRRQYSANQVTKEFGLIASKSALVLMNNVDAVAQLTTKLNNAAGATKRISDIMKTSTDFALKEFNSALEGLKIDIFKEYEDVVKDALNSATKFIQDHKNEIVGSLVHVKNAIEGVINFIINNKEEIQRVFIDLGTVAKMLGSVAAGLTKVFAVVIAGWNKIPDFLKSKGLMVGLLGPVSSIVSVLNLTDKIKESLDDVSDSAAKLTFPIPDQPDYMVIDPVKTKETVKKAQDEVVKGQKETAAEVKKIAEQNAKDYAAAHEKAYKQHGILTEEHYNTIKDKYDQDKEDFIKATGDKETANKIYFEQMTDLNDEYYNHKTVSEKDALAAFEAGIEQYQAKEREAAELRKQNAELAQKHADEMLRAYGNFFEGFSVGVKDSQENMLSWFKVGEAMAYETSDNMSDAFSDGLFNVLKGDMDGFSDIWDDFLNSMLGSFTDMVGEMAAQQVMKTVFGDGGWFGAAAGAVGGSIVGESADAIIDWLIWEKGEWDVSNNQASGIGKAYPDRKGKPGTVAVIHDGEMVIPADISSGLRGGLEQSGINGFDSMRQAMGLPAYEFGQWNQGSVYGSKQSNFSSRSSAENAYLPMEGMIDLFDNELKSNKHGLSSNQINTIAGLIDAGASNFDIVSAITGMMGVPDGFDVGNNSLVNVALKAATASILRRTAGSVGAALVSDFSVGDALTASLSPMSLAGVLASTMTGVVNQYTGVNTSRFGTIASALGSAVGGLGGGALGASVGGILGGQIGMGVGDIADARSFENLRDDIEDKAINEAIVKYGAVWGHIAGQISGYQKWQDMEDYFFAMDAFYGVEDIEKKVGSSGLFGGFASMAGWTRAVKSNTADRDWNGYKKGSIGYGGVKYASGNWNAAASRANNENWMNPDQTTNGGGRYGRDNTPSNNSHPDSPGYSGERYAGGGVVNSLAVPTGEDGWAALRFGEGVVSQQGMKALENINSGNLGLTNVYFQPILSPSETAREHGGFDVPEPIQLTEQQLISITNYERAKVAGDGDDPEGWLDLFRQELKSFDGQVGYLKNKEPERDQEEISETAKFIPKLYHGNKSSADAIQYSGELLESAGVKTAESLGNTDLSNINTEELKNTDLDQLTTDFSSSLGMALKEINASDITGMNRFNAPMAVIDEFFLNNTNLSQENKDIVNQGTYDKSLKSFQEFQLSTAHKVDQEWAVMSQYASKNMNDYMQDIASNIDFDAVQAGDYNEGMTVFTRNMSGVGEIGNAIDGMKQSMKDYESFIFQALQNPDQYSLEDTEQFLNDMKASGFEISQELMDQVKANVEATFSQIEEQVTQADSPENQPSIVPLERIEAQEQQVKATVKNTYSFNSEILKSTWSLSSLTKSFKDAAETMQGVIDGTFLPSQFHKYEGLGDKKVDVNFGLPTTATGGITIAQVEEAINRSPGNKHGYQFDPQQWQSGQVSVFDQFFGNYGEAERAMNKPFASGARGDLLNSIFANFGMGVDPGAIQQGLNGGFDMSNRTGISDISGFYTAFQVLEQSTKRMGEEFVGSFDEVQRAMFEEKMGISSGISDELLLEIFQPLFDQLEEGLEQAIAANDAFIRGEARKHITNDRDSAAWNQVERDNAAAIIGTRKEEIKTDWDERIGDFGGTYNDLSDDNITSWFSQLSSPDDAVYNSLKDNWREDMIESQGLRDENGLLSLEDEALLEAGWAEWANGVFYMVDAMNYLADTEKQLAQSLLEANNYILQQTSPSLVYNSKTAFDSAVSNYEKYTDEYDTPDGQTELIKAATNEALKPLVDAFTDALDEMLSYGLTDRQQQTNQVIKQARDMMDAVNLYGELFGTALETMPDVQNFLNAAPDIINAFMLFQGYKMQKADIQNIGDTKAALMGREDDFKLMQIEDKYNFKRGELSDSGNVQSMIDLFVNSSSTEIMDFANELGLNVSDISEDMLYLNQSIKETNEAFTSISEDLESYSLGLVAGAASLSPDIQLKASYESWNNMLAKLNSGDLELMQEAMKDLPNLGDEMLSTLERTGTKQEYNAALKDVLIANNKANRLAKEQIKDQENFEDDQRKKDDEQLEILSETATEIDKLDQLLMDLITNNDFEGLINAVNTVSNDPYLMTINASVENVKGAVDLVKGAVDEVKGAIERISFPNTTPEPPDKAPTPTPTPTDNRSPAQRLYDNQMANMTEGQMKAAKDEAQKFYQEATSKQWSNMVSSLGLDQFNLHNYLGMLGIHPNGDKLAADAWRGLDSHQKTEDAKASTAAYMQTAGLNDWLQAASNFQITMREMENLAVHFFGYTGNIPQFASGGRHAGGMRVVGEQEAELEFTGSSQIVSNSDIKSMLDNRKVVTAISRLEKKIENIGIETLKANKKTASTIYRWERGGMPTERTTA